MLQVNFRPFYCQNRNPLNVSVLNLLNNILVTCEFTFLYTLVVNRNGNIFKKKLSSVSQKCFLTFPKQFLSFILTETPEVT